MKFKPLFNYIIFTIIIQNGFSQNTYLDKNNQFLAYEKIPTWACVLTNWKDAANRKVHLYNSITYKGHAEFVSKGLKKGITFTQFKAQVRNPTNRLYVPLFIYDLRTKPIKIEKKTYTWAIRLEDYRYEDTPKEMEKFTLDVMITVNHFLNSQQPNIGEGIIILSTNPAASPNISVKSFLNRNQFPSLTLNEMIANFKTTSTSSQNNVISATILNSGTAIGYLKYINADKTSIGSDFKQLLVYELLPYRVPVAGGIITLEPQTPLSHINLLAKNRKTINAYLQTNKQLEKLNPYFDKLVKLEMNELNHSITIKEVTIVEAEKYWKAKKNLKITLPNAILTYSKLIDFRTQDKNYLKVEYIGSKASNYALLQTHFPTNVRNGFAVPFYYYNQTIRLNGVDSLIKLFLIERNKLSETEINKKLKEIRSKIKKSKVPENLLIEIKNICEKNFKNKRIRIRSSTNAEDLPQFNGAGLYESKGFNYTDAPEKIDTLEKKILSVYASLWLERAYQEREFFQINHEAVSMALLINEAFQNEYANGVALTMFINKSAKNLYINSQIGSISITNPENNSTAENIIFENKKNDYIIESKSSIKDIFTNNELKKSLHELKSIVLQIDKLMNPNNDSSFGVDIEFKIMKEKDLYQVYVKQARLLSVTLPE